MDKYIYFTFSSAFLGIAFILLMLRKDIARTVIKYSLMGGFAGMAAEFFYFRDYWRPPSLMCIGKVSIEDFIFGFAISAISITAYPVFTRIVMKKTKSTNKNALWFFISTAIALLLILNLWAGINSIIVSYIIFALFTFAILRQRKDLVRVSLVSAVSVTALVLLIYIPVFDFLSPHFWDKYWLLANTAWGITILGHLPLTEILWYISWVMFASTAGFFIEGMEYSMPIKD